MEQYLQTLGKKKYLLALGIKLLSDRVTLLNYLQKITKQKEKDFVGKINKSGCNNVKTKPGTVNEFNKGYYITGTNVLVKYGEKKSWTLNTFTQISMADF